MSDVNDAAVYRLAQWLERHDIAKADPDEHACDAAIRLLDAAASSAGMLERIDRELRTEIGRSLRSNLTADDAHRIAQVTVRAMNEEN